MDPEKAEEFAKKVAQGTPSKGARIGISLLVGTGAAMYGAWQSMFTGIYHITTNSDYFGISDLICMHGICFLFDRCVCGCCTLSCFTRFYEALLGSKKLSKQYSILAKKR